MAGLHLAERVRHFAQRDAFIKLWFVPVWLGLGLASLAIRLMAFRRIAPLLGRHCGTTIPEQRLTPQQICRAQQIGRTVQLAERYAPWRADCYPQALVARALLGLCHVPFVLCLGLRRDADAAGVVAHAWIRSGTVMVTGGPGEAEHTVVSVFAAGLP